MHTEMTEQCRAANFVSFEYYEGGVSLLATRVDVDIFCGYTLNMLSKNDEVLIGF